MASKNGLEYDVRGIDIDTGGKWADAHLKIKGVCEKMNRSGWELSTMAWPHLEHVVLVFTRSRRAEG